jgi:hypothetical protein
MKRKWPGVNKQLEILNKGLREQYGTLMWTVNHIVKDAEKGYGRGSFNTALTTLVQDYFGTYGPDDEFFDKWHHNGFSAASGMVIDWFGEPDHYSNISYATIQIRFEYLKGEWRSFHFPVEVIKDDGGNLKRVNFRAPGFEEVHLNSDDEKVDTDRHDKREDEMKRLISDLNHCINPLMRIVLGDAKQKRYRIRDMINEVARKYEVKEAIYTEEDDE